MEKLTVGQLLDALKGYPKHKKVAVVIEGKNNTDSAYAYELAEVYDSEDDPDEHNTKLILAFVGESEIR